jgi:NADH-quinone oxidoreductase subunit H
MDLGWKLLIPLALGWFLLLVGVRVAADLDWNIVVVVAVGVAGLALGAALLRASIRSAAAKREVATAGEGR